ncbi:small multi-drug export protein [Methanoculleus sp. FWC-SCC1]|uniref:Small multi-drug export protein n=1 Tax=Methanoculleus frigidifontis TaxID=2584085 RepID=A0ABT8MBP8_9EURY|nr:small multi-drug export protein [Methanoculleus sp. FWC-SCC1]MDN7025365.1 small multi-drug export protein [Methanoculleus sp. FWC-SCC1]
MDAVSALFLMIASALPFVEARYAIPPAILSGQFTAPEAFLLGFIGNVIPVIVVLLLLEPVSIFLSSHSRHFERFFTWLFDRTRKHSERFERWGALALMPFVAVPLPVTGAWTACAAAFVFGIRFRYALPTIAAGILIAALITTLTTIGLLGGFA